MLHNTRLRVENYKRVGGLALPGTKIWRHMQNTAKLVPWQWSDRLGLCVLYILPDLSGKATMKGHIHRPYESGAHRASLHGTAPSEPGNVYLKADTWLKIWCIGSMAAAIP